VFIVEEHKTERWQPACFSLNAEQFGFFQQYHERVQETLSMRSPDDVPMRTLFFIKFPNSKREKPIHGSTEVS
jgi:2-keto-4-pentenoate hydratase/2-oxohepta-3-ene-1,7-dioic acid hydratase in catechol pathway